MGNLMLPPVVVGGRCINVYGPFAWVLESKQCTKPLYLVVFVSFSRCFSPLNTTVQMKCALITPPNGRSNRKWKIENRKRTLATWLSVSSYFCAFCNLDGNWCTIHVLFMSNSYSIIMWFLLRWLKMFLHWINKLHLVHSYLRFLITRLRIERQLFSTNFHVNWLWPEWLQRTKRMMCICTAITNDAILQKMLSSISFEISENVIQMKRSQWSNCKFLGKFIHGMQTKAAHMKDWIEKRTFYCVLSVRLLCKYMSVKAFGF